MVRFDDGGQLEKLAASIMYARTAAVPLVAAAVKKGAQNVKTSIIKDLHTSSYKAIRRIPISYELETDSDGTEARIGPAAGGAGSLANIAFFGTAKGGGTHQFYEHGQEELPKTADYVRKALEESWR